MGDQNVNCNKNTWAYLMSRLMPPTRKKGLTPDSYSPLVQRASATLPDQDDDPVCVDVARKPYPSEPGHATNAEAIRDGADEGGLLAAWFASSEVEAHEERMRLRRERDSIKVATQLSAPEAIARVTDGVVAEVEYRVACEMHSTLGEGLLVWGLLTGGWFPFSVLKDFGPIGAMFLLKVRFDRELADAERTRGRVNS